MDPDMQSGTPFKQGGQSVKVMRCIQMVSWRELALLGSEQRNSS